MLIQKLKFQIKWLRVTKANSQKEQLLSGFILWASCPFYDEPTSMNCRDDDRNIFIKMPQSWEGEGKRDFSALCTIATPRIFSGAGMPSLCSRVLGWRSCQQVCPLSVRKEELKGWKPRDAEVGLNDPSCLLLGPWSLFQSQKRIPHTYCSQPFLPVTDLVPRILDQLLSPVPPLFPVCQKKQHWIHRNQQCSSSHRFRVRPLSPPMPRASIRSDRSDGGVPEDDWQPKSGGHRPTCIWSLQTSVEGWALTTNAYIYQRVALPSDQL